MKGIRKGGTVCGHDIILIGLTILYKFKCENKRIPARDTFNVAFHTHTFIFFLIKTYIII